jgi:phage FluMu protein Com
MAETARTIVACGRCGRALDERSDTPAAKRQPCPRCWSMNGTVYGATPLETGPNRTARGVVASAARKLR